MIEQNSEQHSQKDINDGHNLNINEKLSSGMQEQIQNHHLNMPKNKTSLSPSYENFIKSLKAGLNDNIICLYQSPPFVVQVRNLRDKNIVDVENGCDRVRYVQSSQQHMQSQKNRNSYNLGKKQETVLFDIQFQTVPYDCIQIRPNYYLISTKSMPPRLYTYQQQNHQVSHFASLIMKKKNSEKYLSPIQFASFHNKTEYVVGGGHRFLCLYNLEKLMIDSYTMFEKFDKSNISAVSMINQNVSIVGGFEGWLALVDIRDSRVLNQMNSGQSRQVKSLLRPHVDALMSIATTPQNQNIFSTSARKDDYTYIWDIRTYAQNMKYLCQLSHARNGNQRISQKFSHDGSTLYSGTQNSQIIGWKYNISSEAQGQQQVKTWKLQSQGTTVNSVVNIKSQNGEDFLIYSTGHRAFQNIGSQDQSFDLGETMNSSINKLGLLNLNQFL